MKRQLIHTLSLLSHNLKWHNHSSPQEKWLGLSCGTSSTCRPIFAYVHESRMRVHKFSFTLSHPPYSSSFRLSALPSFPKHWAPLCIIPPFQKKKKNPINYLLLEEEWMLMAIKWTDGDMGGKKSHRNNAQTKIYFNRYIKGILCILTQKQSLSIITY